MSHLYPFISPLDSLVFDSVVDNKPSDIETEANLALWVMIVLPSFFSIILTFCMCRQMLSLHMMYNLVMVF